MRKPLLQAFLRSLFLQIAALCIFAGLLGWQLERRFSELFLNHAATHLRHAIALFADRIPALHRERWCETAVRDVNLRVTLAVPQDGRLLCDSAYGYSPTRPLFTTHTEIPDAVQSSDHTGHSRRLSQGLGAVTGLFEARYFPEKNVVLRVGFSLNTLQEGLSTIRWITWSGTLALAAVLCAVLYVTNRRWLFSNTLTLVDRAEEEMQKRLVAQVSHEFRTPLTAIQGFGTMIEQDVRSGRAVRPAHAVLIRKESERLLQMVNALLDLSIREKGQVKLSRVFVSTEALTRDVLEVLHPLFPSRVDSIATDHQAKQIFGDHEQLHQLLLNLLDNALKYTPADTQISVHWRAQGTQVELVVEDDGPGIPAELRDRLFHPFVRGRNPGISGAGLGLTIVRGIVDAHGARLREDAGSHRGVKWIISFPQS